ncbi:unnamed protein product, partial [Mesorhabditis belari]|uniref:Vacuolar protein sorting-associated protein 11 homolog n=1 Tax=Mesorhabditis belari TaxID=2138241 RepID=A0AAF3FGB2_9BILA
MSQVELGWRRFNFFDKFIINDPEKPGERFLGLKDVVVDCCASVGDVVYLGEEKGAVFRVTKDFKEYFWRCFQHSLAHLKAVGAILLSVGKDEPTESLIKIWNTDQLEKGSPLLMRTIRIGHAQARTSTKCTMVTGDSNLRAVAIGFDDGTVAVYIGDILKDRAVTSQWLRVRDSSPQDGPITGLCLSTLSTTSGPMFVLFVLTPKIIQSHLIENKTIMHTLRHNSPNMNGVDRMCWAFDEIRQELVVANRDMVFFFNAQQCLDPNNTQGKCHALGRAHDTLQLVEADGFIALLTRQPALIPTSEAEWMSLVSVYDVNNKYIGFSCSLPSACTLIRLGSTIMILSRDGTLSALVPKHLNAKLEILYRKNFYDVALSLAKKCEEAVDKLPTIHAKYADYLYSKGDFANAIEQYKDTMGHLEPSYVIKRFLDASKIQQLCAYLETLHAKRLNNSHHTTILINCYAKMADKSKIRKFVEQTTKENCDLEAAISVLRSSSLYEPASLLALKHQMHGHHLRILIDDQRKYDRAIRYLQSLDPIIAVDYLEEYGRSLLEAQPEETMKLITKTVASIKENDFDASRLLKVFIVDSSKSTQFIETIIDKVPPICALTLKQTIIELRLREYVREKGNLQIDTFMSNVIPLISDDTEDHALQLARIFDCPPLQRFILERSEKKSPDLIQFYIKQGKLKDLIESCKKRKDRSLWLETLVFISQIREPIEERLLKEMLDEISSENLVHPLVVLEILSRSETLKVSTVREYVIQWLQKQEKQISEDKKAIVESEKRMVEVQAETEKLHFKVQTIQAAKCCACATALQLPAIHFLCKHSFHVHCFESYAEQADACPACAAKYTPSEQRIAQTEKLMQKGAHAIFQNELKNSSNGISIVADYVGRGLFSATSNTAASVRASHSTDAPRNNYSTNPFDEDNGDERSSNTTSSGGPTLLSRQISRVGRVPSGTKPQTISRNPFDESTNPFDSDE